MGKGITLTEKEAEKLVSNRAFQDNSFVKKIESASPNLIKARVDKAEFEISIGPQFDYTVINDDLETAVNQVHDLITDFIDTPLQNEQEK